MAAGLWRGAPHSNARIFELYLQRDEEYPVGRRQTLASVRAARGISSCFPAPAAPWPSMVGIAGTKAACWVPRPSERLFPPNHRLLLSRAAFVRPGCTRQ